MPRKLLKRWLPGRKIIKNTKGLHLLGKHLHNKNLWRINRKSISRATAIGLFTCFLPIPFQMVVAAGFAMIFYANLPVSVVTVWISNPITMPPMLYAAYKLGTYVMQLPGLHFNSVLNWQWLIEQIGQIWYPMIIGCLIFGFLTAVLGYYTIRLLWRLWVLHHWHKRKDRVSAL